MRKLHLAAGLVAGVNALALGSIAYGQTAAAPELEEIIVTGSRIVQNGNNMPTPVTVVSTEQLLQDNAEDDR